MSKIEVFRLLYTPVDPSLVFAMPLLDVNVGSPSRYCYLASVQSYRANAVLPTGLGAYLLKVENWGLENGCTPTPHGKPASVNHSAKNQSISC